MEYEIVRGKKEKRTYEDLQYGRFFRFVDNIAFADGKRGTDTVFFKVQLSSNKGLVSFESGQVYTVGPSADLEIIELEQIHPMKFREIDKDGHPINP